MSQTRAQRDMLQHVAELRYKDVQLTLKCSALAKAMGESLSNQVEFGVSNQMALLTIESQAYDDKNRVILPDIRISGFKWASGKL